MTAARVYPLTWPQGFPRYAAREAGRFQTSLSRALKNVQESLRLFGKDSDRPVANIVISSNVSLGDARPDDPGVAVWFEWERMQVCIAVDRYTTPEANLQAIHLILEARRVELRHGTLNLVRATFTGFKALPPPPGKHWRDILQIAPESTTRDAIERSYRRLAAERHPDRGGSAEAMAELNNARTVALREIGA